MVIGKVQLKDGRAVLVRHAAPGDVPDIGRLLRELSPESFRPVSRAVSRRPGTRSGAAAARTGRTGRDCPLVTSGHCRLAEEADLIIPALPGADVRCAAVTTAHRRLWAGKLAT